jgi:hypothetical protein
MSTDTCHKRIFFMFFIFFTQIHRQRPQNSNPERRNTQRKHFIKQTAIRFAVTTPCPPSAPPPAASSG